jgi:subtilisin family serine protease
VGRMSTRAAVATLAMVAMSAVVTFTPSLSAASPTPSSFVRSAAGGASAPGQLLVGYAAGVSSQQRDAARVAVQARLVDRVVPARADRAEVELVSLPSGASLDGAIRALEAQPGVAYAEPNWVLTIGNTSDDPIYTNGSLWGMYGDATSPANQFGSQAGEAWAAGVTGSKSIYVGVIDEGIDVSHPDLDANVWVNPVEPVDGKDNDGNGYIDDVHGWDFHNNDRTVYDGGTGDKHGTHVAGTIGAERNGAGVVGTAWDVTLISAKFLGSNGGYTSNAVKAVNYLTDLKTRHGIDIVASNNSWGGGGYSQSLHDAIIRGAKVDILFIAAAGNNATNNDTTIRYPSAYNTMFGTSTQTAALYDAVIAVASTTNTGALSSFSNFGATTVDLGAPGSAINSTLPGNTYGSYNGTSMATPHVAGAAVLLAAGSGNPRGAGLRTAVLAATTPTGTLSGKTVTGGRLDLSGVAAATTSATQNRAPVAAVSATPSSGVAPLAVQFSSAGTSDPDGDTLSYQWNFGNGATSTAANPSYTYTDAGTFTATLTVTDPGGASASASTTVVVTAPVSATANVSLAKVPGVRAGTATVTVGANGLPVAGASVSLTWSGVVRGTVTGSTNSDGQVSFTSKTATKAGTLTATVSSVTPPATHTWDGVKRSASIAV